MNPALATPPTATAIARPDIDRVVAGLRHRNRWKMLKELSCGEPRTIAELAKVAGCGYDNASQHLRQSPSNTCPVPASPSWITATACSGWMRRPETGAPATGATKSVGLASL